MPRRRRHFSRSFDRKPQDRRAALDQIALLEIGDLDLLAVHVSSVVASKVRQPAAWRIHFDEKMQSGKIRLFIRQTEVSASRTTRQKHVMFVEDKLLALMGTF